MVVGLASAGGAFAVAMLFLTGLAAKERDDRFCVSCHLHEDKYTRYLGPTARDLAGAHRRADRRVGCIACHGGADLAMRLRVWTVAGFDTLRFLAGVYTEPEHMRLPLRDAECRQCHAVIVKARDPAGGSSSAPAGAGGQETMLETLGAPPAAAPGFHGMREHDTVNVRCVRCHASHVTADGSVGHFLAASVIEPVCRECHPGM